MKSVVVLLAALGCSFLGYAQFAADSGCFAIKYLDFFGLDDLGKGDLWWPKAEIEQLLHEDFSKGPATSFIIPFIVAQLPQYHPDCQGKTDTSYLNQLLKLYLRIRRQPAERLDTMSVSEKIEWTRDDFYSQVNIDSFLAHMWFTFDDGPFFGRDVEQPRDKIASFSLGFGQLVISQTDERIVLTAIDTTNHTLWSKALTREGDYYLRNLSLSEDPIEQTSLATTVSLTVEGEMLTLFLRNNGAFMFYYHSW